MNFFNPEKLFTKIDTETLNEEGNPCFKQSVKAVIVTTDNQTFYGTNNIQNEVSECPRVTLGCKTGEGYEHCKNTCNQNEHAEVVAVRKAIKAGVSLKGASVYVSGHTYCCDNCTKVMKANGVEKAFIVTKTSIKQIEF